MTSAFTLAPPTDLSFKPDQQPQHAAQAGLAGRDRACDGGRSWHLRNHATDGHVEADCVALAGAVYR
jgi:hypothetical protein